MKEMLYLALLMAGGCGIVKVVGMSYAVYQNCVETQKDIVEVEKRSAEIRRELDSKGQ